MKPRKWRTFSEVTSKHETGTDRNIAWRQSATATQRSRKEYRAAPQGANRVTKEMSDTDRMAQKLNGTVTKLVSAFAVKQLVSAIAKTRGEFQQLEVAFTTMLGSAEKANALMSQLTKTAATTPFGLEEVSKGAKQLLAYGFEAEKVNETLIRLGDIAAGLSVPSMILCTSTARQWPRAVFTLRT